MNVIHAIYNQKCKSNALLRIIKFQPKIVLRSSLLMAFSNEFK